MARILDLPTLADPTGAEIAAVVKGGVTYQAPLSDLVDGALAIGRVEDIEAAIGAPQTIGRPVTPVDAGSGAQGGTYCFDQTFASAGYIRSFWVWAKTAGTIKIRRFEGTGKPGAQIGADHPIAVVPGLNQVVVDIAHGAGERIGFHTPSGVVAFSTVAGDSGGYYTTTADSNGFTDPTPPRTNIRLEIGFTSYQPIVTQQRITAAESKLLSTTALASKAASGMDDIATAGPALLAGTTATAHFGSASNGGTFGGWTGFIKPVAAVDTVVDRLEIDHAWVGAAATKIKLQIYQRPDAAADSSAPPSACSLVFEKDYPLADLGMTAAAAERKHIAFEFPTPFVAKAGWHLAWRWEAQDAAGARQTSSMGYLVDNAATGGERGWYYSGVGSTSYTAITSPNRLAARIYRTSYSIGDGATNVFEQADAQVSITGTSITAAGAIERSGISGSYSQTLAVTLAAAGKERIDKLVIDRTTKAVSLVAGSVRDATLDALEWQAATPANALVIARVKVTDAAATPVATAGFRDLIKVGGEADMMRHIDRNRRILRRVIGKAMRGQAIKLGGYGDSITAIQSSSPTYAANGTMRDRGTDAYLASYPADSKALLALYDTGDGAGQVHTRLGWNWDIKAALDEMADAEVVQYLNYGIGSTTSQNSEPTAGRGNGLWPARIAVPLGDGLDAVVIAFGMNERGQSYTYGNIVNMVGQFQAAGVIPIVMGCPRPNANQSLSAWRTTNDALEAAAMDTGAAFISTSAIADDITLGAMGVPASALCSANTISGGNNHPGIFELRRYGRAAVIQLGLA